MLWINVHILLYCWKYNGGPCCSCLDCRNTCLYVHHSLPPPTGPCMTVQTCPLILTVLKNWKGQCAYLAFSSKPACENNRAYGKAGNGNWKWKPETENRNGNATVSAAVVLARFNCYPSASLPPDFALLAGRLQSLDWTSGLDWWTDLKNHFYAF